MYLSHIFQLEKERSAHEMEMKNLEAEMDELKDQLRRAREGVGEEVMAPANQAISFSLKLG